jgi:hypothetical protein
MPNSVEMAAKTYIKAWSERDPVVRAKLIEACFAADGRVVTRSREIRGRAALADAIAGIHADPQFLRIRVTSAIDARGTTFRFRGVAERSDGTSPEAFDAGRDRRYRPDLAGADVRRPARRARRLATTTKT